MEINYLFNLWRVCFLFWLTNFIVGFPISFYFWIKYKSKIYVYLSQIIGFSLWGIIFSWSYVLGVSTLLRFWWLVILFFVFISCLIVFKLVRKKKIDKEIIKNYINNSVLSFFVYVFVLFIFVVPQSVFPPFAPGYKVNEDAIGILYSAKVIETGQRNGLLFQGIFDDGYPLGFSITIILFSKLIGYNMYFSVYLLNLLLLCLAFFPIKCILQSFFVKKVREDVLFISTFFGMITYLSIQFINQLFCAQTFLVPFLFSVLLMTIRIFISNSRKTIDFILFSLFLAVSIFAYSFTVFLWLLPFVLILLVYFFIKKNKKWRRIWYLFVFGGLSVFLVLPHFLRAVSLYDMLLFSPTLRSDGTGGFWGAKGNTFGYASVLNAFSSWLGTDFRLYKDIFIKNSVLFFIFLVSVTMLSLIVYRNFIIKKRGWMALSLFVCFLFPILISKYFLKSTYYYNKTLFYGSFVFVSLITTILLLNVFYKKITLLLVGTVLILSVFVNNMYRSFHYFGKPPLHKFLALEEMNINLKSIDFNENIIAVDKDDWLKYFLFDFGSCVAFAKMPCGTKNIEIVDKELYRLSPGNYYLLSSENKNKVINIEDGTIIYESVEYVLYHF